MRLAILAVAGLAFASTAALGSTSAVAPTGKPTCAATLEKLQGAAGYQVARKCVAATDVAQQPMGDVLGQSEGADSFPVVLSLFTVAAIGAGVYVALEGDDTVVFASP